MKSIKFDEGYEEYMIGDDPSRSFKLRVSDIGLLSRVQTAMKETDALLAKYKNKPDIEQVEEFDKEFRAIINKAFGTDICTPVFGGSSVLTLTSSGKFLFSEFFDAFIPQLKADIEASVMTQKINAPEVRPAVRKYVDAPVVKPVGKPVAGLANPYGTALPDVSALTPEQKAQLIAQLIS